jgi:hypothetical protein
MESAYGLDIPQNLQEGRQGMRSRFAARRSLITRLVHPFADF